MCGPPPCRPRSPPIDNTTTLPRSRARRRSAIRGARATIPAAEPIAQRHDAQNRGFAARHLRDMVRQRNDLAYAIERQRIFLLAKHEADQ